MKLSGYVRDSSARALVQLSRGEDAVSAEVIIDTGFEGELALPEQTLSRVELLSAVQTRPIMLADGTLRDIRYCFIALPWGEVDRTTEVLLTNGSLLAGMTLLESHTIQIEVIDGGEVAIEPL